MFHGITDIPRNTHAINISEHYTSTGYVVTAFIANNTVQLVHIKSW